MKLISAKAWAIVVKWTTNNKQIYFQLVFESKFEEGATYGTIALDDVEILYTACPEDSGTVSVPLEAASARPAETTPLYAPPTTTETEPTSSTTESSDEVSSSEEVSTASDQLDNIEDNSVYENRVD